MKCFVIFLGYRFMDAEGNILKGEGRSLESIMTIDTSHGMPWLRPRQESQFSEHPQRSPEPTSTKDAAVVMKDGVVSAFKGLGDFLEGCSFFKVIETLWNGLMTIGIGIGKALGTLTGGLFDKLTSGSFVGFFDTLNTSMVYFPLLS